MNIQRNISSTKKLIENKETRNDIVFDIQTLTLYCRYVLSENSRIRGTHLSNLRTLFNSIDMTPYQGDPDRQVRVEFIKRALTGLIDYKLRNNRMMLIQFINGGPTDTPLLDTFEFKELSNDEVDYINETVSEIVKYLFIYKYVNNLMDVCQRLKMNSFSRKSDIVNEFETMIDNVKSDFRRSKNESYTESDFSLATDTISEKLSDVYSKEVNPSRKLVSGMQGLNLVNGGAFEASRVYMIFGTAAAGKSFTALDLAIQLKKYNPNYICHDKTKKPCVVLLTMENSVQETVSRLFSMVSAGKSMKDMSFDEVMDIFKNDKHLVMGGDNQIDLIIKYKPNLSIDTSYLYTMVEDLADEGYEPMCVIQDHIKRIRAAHSMHDIRLDLGEIVNEFKAFAVQNDLVFISISHLNREAAKIIDDAKRANKHDLGRLLGRSNVSESMLMIDNCDVGYIITKDSDKYGNLYLDVSVVKSRINNEFDYFCQPFEKGNKIKLVEDYNNPVPAYTMGLKEEKLDNRIKNDYMDGIKPLEEEDEDSLDKFSKYKTVDDILTPKNQNQYKFEVVGGPSKPVYSTDTTEKDKSQNNKVDRNDIIFNIDMIDSPIGGIGSEPPSTNNQLNPLWDGPIPDGARSAVYFLDDDGNCVEDGIGNPCEFFPTYNPNLKM